MANKTAGDNALKSGAGSARVVIEKLGETVADWVAFRDGWHEMLSPDGPAMAEQATRIAGISWRLRRCEHVHNLAVEYAALGQETEALGWIEKPTDGELGLLTMMGHGTPGIRETLPAARASALAAIELMTAANAMAENSYRYEISLERSMLRAIETYQRMAVLSRGNDDDSD